MEHINLGLPDGSKELLLKAAIKASNDEGRIVTTLDIIRRALRSAGVLPAPKDSAP